MATRGFEFAYMLDGSNATPVIRDFVLGVAAIHLIGDLMLTQSDEYIDAVTGTTTEVTCIMMEEFTAAQVTAGTTLGKAAILTRGQVWRCSSDAAAVSGVIAYTKTQDTVDKNTLDADDISNGAMGIVENTKLDSDGNIILYVVFLDTSFGNL